MGSEHLELSYKSSANNIRITQNEDNTVSFTVIDDKSHGHRTYIFGDTDIENITEVLQKMG